jgi:hypothetical protein
MVLRMDRLPIISISRAMVLGIGYWALDIGSGSSSIDIDASIRVGEQHWY